MCLNNMHKIKRFWWREGYKIFKEHSGKLSGQYHYNLNYENGYPVNMWLKDNIKVNLYSNCGRKYKSGFHFYKNKENAMYNIFSGEVVKKVLVRNIVATGEQLGKVGVAREMMILEE